MRLAYRNFVHRKFYSFLNLVGLTAGILAFLLIVRYILREHSFDNFHANAKSIYRVRTDEYQNGALSYSVAVTFPPVGPAMKKDFPEVKEFVRFFPVRGVVTYKENVFFEKKMFFADNSVFKVFSFPVVSGDKENGLANINSVVISESMAEKYFGHEDPLGKVLKVNTRFGEVGYIVTAVIKDVPFNSHLQFDCLFSYKNLVAARGQDAEDNWHWYDFYTYVLLEPGTKADLLEKKFPAFIEQHKGGDLKKYNLRDEYFLQPLEKIHLHSNFLQEAEVNGNYKVVSSLLIIAICIILIAWANYTNIATALAFERAREIGVRKVLGSERSQLLKQFFAEAFMLNAISVILALFVGTCFSFLFNDLLGESSAWFLVTDPVIWLLIVLLLLTGTFLSGLYPAFVLTSINPIQILKGNLNTRHRSGSVRNILLVLQFTAAVVLLIITSVVFRQISFMRSQDLGYKMDDVLVVKGPSVVQADSLYRDRYAYFRDELLHSPFVKNVSASSTVPGDEIMWTTGSLKVGDSPDNGKVIYVIAADTGYISTYQLPVLAGRNFSGGSGTDLDAVLLNEAALKMLQLPAGDKAIGHRIYIGDRQSTVTGVIADFHHESLDKPVKPVAFIRIYESKDFYYYSVKLNNTDDIKLMLSTIEKNFRSTFPGNPFEYFFQDEFFNRQYKDSDRMATLFLFFTILAIVIACLGLFGLVALGVTQRKKEIGIRKSVGASQLDIAILFFKVYLPLVGISVLAGCLAAYFLSHRWLDDFPSRINLNMLYFILPACAVTAIALVTIMYSSLRVVKINLIEIIRD